jgi:hypothetical protein
MKTTMFHQSTGRSVRHQLHVLNQKTGSSTPVFLGDALWELDPAGEKRAPVDQQGSKGGFNGLRSVLTVTVGSLWFKGVVVKIDPVRQYRNHADGFGIPAAVNFDPKVTPSSTDRKLMYVDAADLKSGGAAEPQMVAAQYCVRQPGLLNRKTIFLSRTWLTTDPNRSVQKQVKYALVLGELAVPGTALSDDGKTLYVADVLHFARSIPPA